MRRLIAAPSSGTIAAVGAATRGRTTGLHPIGGTIMEWMLMPLKRYAEFSGRSRRKEYWMFALFLFLVYIAFAVVGIALGMAAFMGRNAAGGSGLPALGIGAVVVVVLFGIFILAILLPSIAVAVRRLHDTDRSGWWFVLPIAAYPLQIVGALVGSSVVSLIGSLAGLGLSILLLVWYCTDGTPGPNRYGPDPKGRYDPSVFA